MVRRHMFCTIFLVLAFASMLQGEGYTGIFPDIVRKLPFDKFGQDTQTFFTQLAGLSSGYTSGMRDHLTQFHKDVRGNLGDRLPEFLPGIFNRFGSLANPSVLNGVADASAAAVAEATGIAEA